MCWCDPDKEVSRCSNPECKPPADRNLSALLSGEEKPRHIVKLTFRCRAEMIAWMLMEFKRQRGYEPKYLIVPWAFYLELRQECIEITGVKPGDEVDLDYWMGSPVIVAEVSEPQWVGNPREYALDLAKKEFNDKLATKAEIKPTGGENGK